MSETLKKEILVLLGKDVEFRYAVAGYLGFSEILKRLDTLAEEQRRLWEANNKLWEEVRGLREEQRRLWEANNKLWNTVNKLLEEVRRLREVQNGLLRRVSSIEAYMERTSISLEEEAWEVVEYYMRGKGIEVKLDRLVIEGVVEVNIYGATKDLCIIGEASVRAGVSTLEKINRDVEKLRGTHPEYLRPKIIKVLYTNWVTPEAVERAKEQGILLLKSGRELTPLIVHS